MQDKSKLYLEIADSALILSHRLAENSSQGPFLEEDLACSNVALDLLGLAELIYIEIARIENNGTTSDDIVYRRSESEYLNALLVEQPSEDFAVLMTRQFFMDNFHYHLFTVLTACNDDFLQAVALKSLKEVTYHLKRSSEWMLRLGNGTALSKEKTQHAINLLWRYTDELFTSKVNLNDIQINFTQVKQSWEDKTNEIFFLANLKKPTNSYQISGGKMGIHSEHLGYILAEMQYLPSKYPDAKW